MHAEDAQFVDAAMKDIGEVRAGDALKRQMLEDFDDLQRAARQRRLEFGFVELLWSRFRVATAGALAGVCAMGVAAGSISATTVSSLSPEEELYLYAEDVDFSSELGEEVL